MDADQGLRRVPQQPEGHRGIGSADNTRILAHAKCQCRALVWCVMCTAFLQVQACSRQGAKPIPRCPKSSVGNDRERGVVGMLCQAQQGSPKLSCWVQV